MKYWWVNHNQTAREEVEGQYLWSPKTESNGAVSQFYANMRRASPGNLVLSYASQAVRFVGRVTEFAFTAPKPKEFGNRGQNWSHEGWLLPVFWTPLDPPVSPRAVINVLGPLLPQKYSPIHPITGNGNQKAYLAEISSVAFETIIQAGHFSRASLAHGGANSLTFQVVSELLDDAVEDQIRAEPGLEQTVRKSLIEARRGQGAFRKNVEALEDRCRLTGITNPSLLIASHIKPWRLCTSANERLDGENGLLMTPDADLLFDRGFITFRDNGEVMKSPRVDDHDLRRLGFDHLILEKFGVAEAPAMWRTEAFLGARSRYMDYHRREIFVA